VTARQYFPCDPWWRDDRHRPRLRPDFTPRSFRDKLTNGRKVAILILEFFDRHGITIAAAICVSNGAPAAWSKSADNGRPRRQSSRVTA